ncbi:hypothetical protein GCM10023310_04760 [Paenibacillus vulneris]|uniref:Uncharacterized protein n=1 Tax=Paenibacillus vulneris TaxID=1133364 RepID=A0ABW3ULL1_9BACL|nr:hypothetical protein [Paenibacillus sp. 32352]
MNEIKKQAYRKLIYLAFLDIKNSGSFNEENCYRNFRIAHAFHNLAESMIDDLKGFDEVEFWNTIESLEKQFNLNHYRETFCDNIRNL